MHTLTGLLLLQIALVSPNGGPRVGDVLPADFGPWHAALAANKPPEKFSRVSKAKAFSPTDAAELIE